MSISALPPIDLTSLTTQASWQSMQRAFQQVGNDLQSGNLAAAQNDYVTLSKDNPASATGSASAAGRAYSQLGQDLRSGNLAAAQLDYASLKRDTVQPESPTTATGAAASKQGTVHHHRHHATGDTSSSISQLLDSASPALQAYNTSTSTGSTLSFTA